MRKGWFYKEHAGYYRNMNIILGEMEMLRDEMIGERNRTFFRSERKLKKMMIEFENRTKEFDIVTSFGLSYEPSIKKGDFVWE